MSKKSNNFYDIYPVKTSSLPGDWEDVLLTLFLTFPLEFGPSLTGSWLSSCDEMRWLQAKSEEN